MTLLEVTAALIIVNLLGVMAGLRLIAPMVGRWYR